MLSPAAHTRLMADKPTPERLPASVCRWRTSGETLDVIEALERIEALLVRLDERVRAIENPPDSERARIPAPGGVHAAEGGIR